MSGTIHHPQSGWLWWLWLVAALCLSHQAHAASTWSASATPSGTPAQLSLSGQLVVSDADRGQSGTVFVAAVLPDARVYTLSNGHWSAVTDGTLTPYYSGALGTHTVNVLTGQDTTTLAGTVIYAGYGRTAQDMLNLGQYTPLYTLPGSMSGPATAGDWLTFTLNVQDFAYPDRSADAVDRVITLHERYKVPVDIYLTDTALAGFETNHPGLMTRLRGSPYVALNYHIRPPKPYYARYDWAGLGDLGSADQMARIRDYETHVTDPITGLPGSTSGGFARLKQLTGNHPVIASFQADTLYDSVSQVFRELGASMTVSHAMPYINLGTTVSGLAVRPEHYDLKLFQSPGQSVSSLIEAGFAAAHNTPGAASPYVMGVKMHDNDFFALASAWTTTYIDASRAPPWDTSTVADLKSDTDIQAQWTLYESAVAWADSQRGRVAAVNAQGLGAALAAAPAVPLLYVSGTMHIESNRLRWPDPDQLIAFFQRATAAGRVGGQTSAMRWSIGADVGWLRGEARAAELIRTLSALGVEWDIHVHVASDRAEAARLIRSLGGTPNTVASGATVSDLDTLRSAQSSQGESWQADSIWGLGREGSHNNGSEDLSSGLWQPLSQSDWQAHDPTAGRLVVVGGGARTLAGAEALAAQLSGGGYTAPVYSVSLMVDQVTLTVADAANATTSGDGIDQIEAFANRLGALAHVRWASLSGTAAAWRAAGAVPSRIASTQ